MNESEFNKLKQEVAELREEINLLTQHFGVDKFEDGGKSVNLLCSAITLFNYENPNETQGCISGGPDGPELSLWDKDGKPRLSVLVDKDGTPAIQIFDTEKKLAVHIGYAKDNCSAVGVFHNGEPRAAIKGSDNSGYVSAVHKGGQARVSMISNESSGQIMLLNPDMKVAVKLSTQGQHDEGFITVNHSNGKAAVIISALPEHGCVILNDRGGKVKYTVPNAEQS